MNGSYSARNFMMKSLLLKKSAFLQCILSSEIYIGSSQLKKIHVWEVCFEKPSFLLF